MNGAIITDSTAEANSQTNGNVGHAEPQSDAHERHDMAHPQLQQLVQTINNAEAASRLQAVQQTRTLLASNGGPSIDVLVASGTLTALVNCLSVDDPQLQYEAALTLTNIASGTSVMTSAVVEAGAVLHFIRLLHSPHRDVCEQAVWALSNIIGLS